MNERNPPPYHLSKAEMCRRVQTGTLLMCLGILLYLLIALETANLLTLLLVFLFVALPLTVAFFVLDNRIKFWEKPYQLYAQEFWYKPQLKSGIHVPIQVEYQYPTTTDNPMLERLNSAAQNALSRHFAALTNAPDYEDVRKIVVDSLDFEVQQLEIEVFRVHVVKIDSPVTRHFISYPLEHSSERAMAASSSDN